MRKLIFMIACWCVFSTAALAQGTLQQSDVRSTPGPVVPGATVTICTTASPLSLIPCFPKATIYTDPAMAVPSVNPITADGNGNYQFYAPAGTYVISVTGQGLPGRAFTIVLACVPLSPSITGCGGGGAGGNPAGLDTQAQFNKGGAFGATSGLGVDNSTSPTVWNIPFSESVKGPRPWVDITNPAFGAKGDGATDDTAAISAAIAFACANNAATVYFPTPPNFYRVTQVQTGVSATAPIFPLCSFIHLKGENSANQSPQLKQGPGVAILAVPGVSPNPAPVFSVLRAENVTIEDLAIQGYNEALYVGDGGSNTGPGAATANFVMHDVNTQVPTTGIGTLAQPNAAEVYGGGLWYTATGGSAAQSGTFTGHSIIILNDTPQQPPGIIKMVDRALVNCVEAKSITSQTGTAGNWTFDNATAEDCNNGYMTVDDDGSHPWNQIFYIKLINSSVADATYSSYFTLNSPVAVHGLVISEAFPTGTAALVTTLQGSVSFGSLKDSPSPSGNISADGSGNLLGGIYAENGYGFDIFSNGNQSSETDIQPNNSPSGGFRAFKGGNPSSKSFASVNIDPFLGYALGLSTQFGPEVALHTNAAASFDVSFPTAYPATSVTATPAVTGGANLAAGTYYYWVAGTSNNCTTGYSAPSIVATAVISGSNNSTNITWAAPPAGTGTLAGFCVMRGSSNQGPNWQLAAQMPMNFVSGAGATSLTDTGSAFNTVGPIQNRVPVAQSFLGAHRFTPTSLGINTTNPLYNLDVNGNAEVLGGINVYTDTGAANAYVVSTGHTVASVAVGQIVTFQAVHANTGTSTLVVDSLASAPIKKVGGPGVAVNLASGDISANQVVTVAWDGTDYEMQSPLGNAIGGGSGTVGNCTLAPAVAYYSGTGTTTTCLNLPAFMQYIYAADSGAVNAYVVSPTTAATLVTGAQIAFTTANTNTGASTINVSSLGVKALTKYGATALVAGDIAASTYYLAVYDGTEWQVVNPSAPQANVVLKNAVNTFTSAATLDLSAATNPNAQRMPNISGGVTSLNGAEVYNIGDSNIHIGANNVDNIVGIVPSSVTLLNADCTQWAVSGTTKTLSSAGLGGCTLLNSSNVTGANFRLNMSAASNANALVLPNQASAAPSTAGATGFDTTNLQPVISDGVIACPYSKEQVNAQTGSGYTVLTTDCGKLVSVSNATAQTLTLPATPPSKGWFIDAENTGVGTWSVSGNGNNIDNAAGSVAIATNQGMRIASNGSGYFTQRGVGGSGGGGSGTIVPSPQFSVGAYSAPGSATSITGIPVPSAPNNVPLYLLETPSGGSATQPVFGPAGVVPRLVAGASDTILSTDRAGEVIYSDNATVAVTLPQAGTAGFASNYVVLLDYTANNILTITPTTSTINGAATLTMGQNNFCFIYSDNTNYYANCTNGQSSNPIVADTGAANAYVVAYPLIQSLETGSTVFFTVAHANTAASTIAVNGLTTKNLTKNGAASLIANDLVTTTVYFAVYDGTQWELVNPSNGDLTTFTAHKFLGNGTGSTAVAAPTTIGSSDTSPNWYAADSGAANAYVVAPTPALTALTTGSAIFFTTTNANSGASTINVSALGVKALDKLGVSALVSGDILSGAVYEAVYDGTEWIVLNASTGSGSGTVNNCGTAKSAAYYSATGTTTSCTSESALTQYLYAADSGSANAYVITLAPALGSLVTGEQAFFTTTHANTTASTINVNGLGVKNITKDGTTALIANDILASTVYEIVWDGTEWQLVNPSTIGAAIGTSLLATGIVDGTAPVTISTSASVTLGGTYNSGYTFNQDATPGAAITYTLPAAAAGKQYCVSNSNGGSANTGTLEILTSAAGQFIEFTDGSYTATGGFVISGGAARDAACVIGIDATHWMLYVQSGTWTKH